ncbi:hypothetical protein [Lactococcus garvieae]
MVSQAGALVFSIGCVFVYAGFKIMREAYRDFVTEKNNLKKDLISLKEEFFFFFYDIKFDSRYQKIIYDFTQSLVNNIYHVEIESLPFDDLGMDPLDYFFADNIQVKIMLDGDVVKELEVNKEFYSISEIYKYLELKIRQFETDNLVISEEKVKNEI